MVLPHPRGVPLPVFVVSSGFADDSQLLMSAVIVVAVFAGAKGQPNSYFIWSCCCEILSEPV